VLRPGKQVTRGRENGGKRPILDLALCAGTDANHFGDINEMAGDRVAAIDAGLARLGDNGDEVTEVGVFEHTGKQKAKG